VLQPRSYRHTNRIHATLEPGVKRVTSVVSESEIVSTATRCVNHLRTRVTSVTTARRQRAGTEIIAFFNLIMCSMI